LVFKKTDSSKDSNSAKDKKTPKKFFEELAEEAGKAAKFFLPRPYTSAYVCERE